MATTIVSRACRRRYERHVQGQDSTEQENSNKEESNKISPRERNRHAQKAWRDRLKQDQSQYAEHRKYETLRVKAYRTTLTEEQNKKYNEKTRLRMKKYRERKKLLGGDNNANKKVPKTRRATKRQRETWRKNKEKHGEKTKRDMEKKQRETWRKNKALQRMEMTTQKRRQINERRRQKYADKKMASKKKADSTSALSMPQADGSSKPSCSYSTDDAKRKAVSRSFKVLPKCPEKFADVVSSLIQESTPRKKATLKRRCISSPSAKRKLDLLEDSCSTFKDTLRKLKKKRSAKDNANRRLLHQAVLAKGKLTKHFCEFMSLSTTIIKKFKSGEDIVMTYHS